MLESEICIKIAHYAGRFVRWIFYNELKTRIVVIVDHCIEFRVSTVLVKTQAIIISMPTRYDVSIPNQNDYLKPIIFNIFMQDVFIW